ncbi:MAG TPA: HEAT repeat domain-containing protein [Polyangiaceae bacterium]|nr:HEAT repeat domain-containing protein [Polyangiaceae bacterium]
MRRVGFSAPAAALLVSLAAHAAPAPPAVARAGGGQPPLAVGFDAQGELRAAVCAAEPCSVANGVALGLPRAWPGSREKTRLAIVGIGNGRRVVVATVPGDRPERRFEAVVAAPLAGNTPLVLFAGVTGLAEGEDGERHGGMVVVAGPDETGARSVAIGDEREDLSLCGRPAILEPREVDPRDLTLRPAKVQRLDASERARAVRLTAERVPDGTLLPPTLLHAKGASSAVGNPAALTDGDLETTWAEGRGGSGKGEFVLFNAPAELAVDGVEFALRPARATPEHGAAPKELWLATTKQLFAITLPEDAWAHPGARYRVHFPAPLKDDCMAVVLDTAFDERPDVNVTLAEVSALTALAGANLGELVGDLAGGGPKAENAKVVLRSLGQPAFDAVAAGFERLDEGGRRAALEVLDAAPCATSAPAYVSAFLGPYDAQRIHARDHLARCGAEAAPLLAPRLASARGRELTTLTDELADIAPAESVALFVPLMDPAAFERRAALRQALGRVADRPEAAPALRRVLADPATPEVALLDVLRALGVRARDFLPESAQALARLAAPAAPLRVRYLRVGPAAELAGALPAAHSLLDAAMSSDADSHVRGAAVHAVRDPRSFQASLLRALVDADPRVRMEAAHALADAADGAATPALEATLKQDRWPAVRGLAAEALGGAPPSPDTDARLVAAVGDDSWIVKRAALAALGARGARAHADVVLERLDDDEEWPAVRLSAARALGALCYAPALGSLTKHARSLADPLASVEDRGVGYAALGALRDLAPPDLAKRLAPLLDKNAPPGARAAADAALRERSPRCRARM